MRGGFGRLNYGEAPKGPPLTRADLVRIGRYLLPEWKPSLLILTCVLLVAILGLVPPLLLREVIDKALPSKDGMLLNLLVAGMIGTRLLAGLIGVWQSSLTNVVAQGMIFDLRRGIYERLLRQSLRFFTVTRSGEIQSRLQNDVGGVAGVIGGTMVSLVTNTVTVTFTVIVLFKLDWMLALVACAVLPAFVLPTRSVGQVRARISKETQERLAELTAYVQETLSVSGFLLVRLFGGQAPEIKRYGEKAAAVRDLQIRQAMAGRWFMMWIMMFITIGPALIYLVGGHEVIAGRLTLGAIVAFVAYLGGLYQPVSALVNVHVDIATASSLFRRIFEYLDLPIEIEEPADPVRLENAKGELRFERVSMAYAIGAPTLVDISFEARPGQMVALVGPSGAGKTTLTYLATRLYDPDEGVVSLDGVDLRQLSLADLPRWMATVTQETTLFNASLAENLRYAKRDATDEELERACRLAQIHETIAALPEGYATTVGERGYKLSGGERQRLAIARVLLRDPRVLILDEATSSLDSRSEALIQTALEPLLEGRTSLVIAHRLSTILRADLILVLEAGRIVERGAHAELLARGGLYSKLYNEQFRIETEA